MEKGNLDMEKVITDTSLQLDETPVVVPEPTLGTPVEQLDQPKTKPETWASVIPLEYFTVRETPTLTGKPLLILTRGKAVEVVKSGKPWLKVRHPKLGDKIGYVSATILENQPRKK